MSEQNLQEIGMNTSSITPKSLNAHNFFNLDCNIGRLHLKIFISISGIQLNKNFCNSNYPVVRTIKND